MRVIAGKARSLKLKTIEGDSTRPTTDRIKETLFNMIHNDLYDSVFLDLFSGSGGIGIEALSRGASKCVFVENNKLALECIKSNLQFTRLSDNAEVLGMDVLTAINKLDNNNIHFDFIFMDPPYNNNFEKSVLEKLSTSCLLNEDTVVIVEASLETDFSYVSDLNFDIIKEKKYKTNKHVFLVAGE